MHICSLALHISALVGASFLNFLKKSRAKNVSKVFKAFLSSYFIKSFGSADQSWLFD